VLPPIEQRADRSPLRTDPDVPTHPGARRPDRVRTVDSGGIGLAVWEWGAPDAPPILFAHGGFDYAATFDLVAPIVADAGWRVVSWDQRGHGDSDRAHLYSWEADVRDAVAIVDGLGPAPIPVVGHSKGGSLMLQLADALPHRVSRLANLDGLPSARSWPDVPDHQRTRMLNSELSGWLDHRRAAADKVRRPGTIEELAERRGRMNPRLSQEWLRYLVQVDAAHADDGWRWKIDPSMRLGGFGPWRPEWSMARLPALGMPVLCVLGMDMEVMGWGTLPEDVLPNLPAGGRFEALEGVGHFVHLEQPERIAELILELVS
jgi:pimeloyl-ACP methyl ester carboxylesterase